MQRMNILGQELVFIREVFGKQHLDRENVTDCLKLKVIPEDAISYSKLVDMFVCREESKCHV